MGALGFKLYRKSGTVEARPYIPGEDLAGVSVSERDTPAVGGMIARDPANPADRWYINSEFFGRNYEEVTA